MSSAQARSASPRRGMLGARRPAQAAGGGSRRRHVHRFTSLTAAAPRSCACGSEVQARVGRRVAARAGRALRLPRRAPFTAQAGSGGRRPGWQSPAAAAPRAVHRRRRGPGVARRACRALRLPRRAPFTGAGGVRGSPPGLAEPWTSELPDARNAWQIRRASGACPARRAEFAWRGRMRRDPGRRWGPGSGARHSLRRGSRRGPRRGAGRRHPQGAIAHRCRTGARGAQHPPRPGRLPMRPPTSPVPRRRTAW